MRSEKQFLNHFLTANACVVGKVIIIHWNAITDISNGCKISRAPLCPRPYTHLISFPIQEYGLNQFSQPLQRHEISIMKENPEIIERLLTSYKLMLDFYGLQLINEDTGCIGKSSPPKDSPSRFRHLNCESPYYLINIKVHFNVSCQLLFIITCVSRVSSNVCQRWVWKY